MIKRILYATDLSEESLKILENLEEFKCLGVEEVIVLRVINLTRIFGTKGIDVNSYIREIEKESKPKLEEIAKRLEDMKFKARIIPPPVGDPVSEIVKYSEGADAIVMGSRGRSTLKVILLGSTAEGVVRRAKIPVIVFKDAIPKLFDKILYAHDLTEKSERLGDYVKYVARSCNSKVLIVHVLERGEVVKEDLLYRMKNELQAKVIIGDGNPPKEIVKIAEMEGAKCIFVGRSEGGMIGCTADFVIRYSKVPVFVA